MRLWVLLCATAVFGLLLTARLVPPLAAQTAAAQPCPRCAWTPPASKTVKRVRKVEDLFYEAASAKPGTTILIADGDYRLDRTLILGTQGLVIRGASGDPARVLLHGGGMTDRNPGVAVAVAASDVTVADLTIGNVGFHGIQVHGERGASRVVVHNVRIFDTGEQLIKGSTDAGPLFADDGLVACSTLEYTDHAPSNYTNGIDVLAGRNWHIRDNVLRRIRGIPQEAYASGPAILFWANSQGTRVERNTIIDSVRGIAFGLGPGFSNLARDKEKEFDHQGGWIRNNVIVNLNTWADEGIEANAAGRVSVDHNTVVTGGALPWAISLRFPQTDALARNNLTSKPVMTRDGGRMSLAGNISGAQREWFVDIERGNASLSGASWPAVDAGVVLADVPEDARRRARAGAAPDAGAFEWTPSKP